MNTSYQMAPVGYTGSEIFLPPSFVSKQSLDSKIDNYRISSNRKTGSTLSDNQFNPNPNNNHNP